MKAYVLVGIQFLLIGFLAWYGGIAGGSLSSTFLLVAIGLGLWAMAAMRFRFNIRPEPRANSRLCTAGPYAFIRHPMYTAVLLATFGMVLNRPESVSFVAWLLLLCDLLVKLAYEESRLRSLFPEYEAYAKSAKRLIPGVY